MVENSESTPNLHLAMTQKRPVVNLFLSARWVAASPENAPVNPLTPANGMSVGESKIEAAKEGWALATSSQAAFWGDRVGRPKVSSWNDAS